MKILGMRFSNRPTMSEHVKWIQKSVRSRLWTLRNLKRSGFSDAELVRVYTTIIRPVIDYGAVVYHSSLTDEQDELLDRLQNQAMKCIFGSDISARKMCEMAGITTLRQRREDLCLKFAKKCSVNPRMEHLFPQKTSRSSCRTARETFFEGRARCDRMKNSPLFYYLRILNRKQGKTYGKRD